MHAAATAVTCTVPTLTAGAAASFAIVLELPPGLDPGNITNTATATSPTPDPDPVSNTATATVNAFVLADTVITKTVLTSDPIVGQPVQFALDLVNNGPQDAPRVVLSDSLAPGLTFVSAQVEGGAACSVTHPEDIDVVTCEVGAVPVGSTARAIVTVQPDPGITTFENGASVGSAALDEISGDNFDTADVTLRAVGEPPPTTTTTSVPTEPSTPTTEGSAGGTVVDAESGSSGGTLPFTGVALVGIVTVGVAATLIGAMLRPAGRRRPFHAR